MPVPSSDRIAHMLYDANASALPREGGGVRHVPLADECVARDPFCFEPHVPPGSYRRVLFVRGLRHCLDEAPATAGASRVP
jgi:hypothetical protein